MVWNLLTNAIKFTPKGGQVQVLLQRVNSHIELSVSDTGIGIPASFLPHVFDRFSQRDSSTTRAYGGLGLGLAICQAARRAARRHRSGSRAPGEGQGATFFVELPLSIVQLEDESRAAHPSDRGDARRASRRRCPGSTACMSSSSTTSPTRASCCERVLEDQGAQVTSFGSAETCSTALKTTRPSVLVSDIGMPGMDGYQLIRALRAGESRGERIPALALTAFARAEDRKRSLVAGYQAHLAKPFDVAELVLVVADLVGR